MIELDLVLVDVEGVKVEVVCMCEGLLVNIVIEKYVVEIV